MRLFQSMTYHPRTMTAIQYSVHSQLQRDCSPIGFIYSILVTIWRSSISFRLGSQETDFETRSYVQYRRTGGGGDTPIRKWRMQDWAKRPSVCHKIWFQLRPQLILGSSGPRWLPLRLGDWVRQFPCSGGQFPVTFRGSTGPDEGIWVEHNYYPVYRGINWSFQSE